MYILMSDLLVFVLVSVMAFNYFVISVLNLA